MESVAQVQEQLALEFAFDSALKLELAQVIRVSDDKVIAQVSDHLALWLKEDYVRFLAEGDDTQSAMRRTICTMFDYKHLCGKEPQKGCFVRSRNIRSMTYEALNPGDYVVVRTGQRKQIKSLKAGGKFNDPTVAILFEDSTEEVYTSDFRYRQDRSESVLDLIRVERIESN